VPWPTPQDYNEAIQNPKHSFGDPELARGAPELTPLGLPRPITGNFASVYRMRCGARDWAVRCFWREYVDMPLRYAAISDHLDSARLPYTVDFDFLDQGIRLGSRWYPILKMEWVEGELLNAYVERNLTNPRAIATLADRWLAMVTSLENSGSAHGDLQHGNVLVVSGELKLVDYDAMFVPALSGRGSHEIGHQNYQHPRRSGRDYGAWVDRFSAWVIYVSLVALAADPGLWKRLAAGDEALLFRKEDFCRPASSAALQVLHSHDDGQVRRLTGQFQVCLGAEPSQIPPLEAALGPSPGVRRSHRPMAATRARQAWRALIPSAPQLATTPAGSPPITGISGPSASALPGWLHDHVPAPPPAESFCRPVLVSRLAAASTPAAAVLVGAWLQLQGLPFFIIAAAVFPLAVIASCAILLILYRREPAVRTMRAIMRREAHQAGSLARLERSVDRLQRARTRTSQHHATRRERLVEVRSALEQGERREQDEARRMRNDALSILDRRLLDVEEQLGATLVQALENARAGHVRSHLRSCSVAAAGIPGLTITARLRLRALGVRTAADLTSERIRTLQWLEPKTLLALVGWRVDREREARRAAPKRLSAAERDRVAAPYAQVRARLDARRAHATEEAWALEAAISRHFEGRYTPIDARLRELDRRQREADRAIVAQLQGLTASQASEFSRLAAIQRELDQFRNITLAGYVALVFFPRRPS
jgi:hypothetical protein